MTPLDAVVAAMNAEPEDEAARLRCYERLVDVELFLVLESEPGSDDISPLVLETGSGSFVLGFDTEERMADFTDNPTPYAALSGRRVLSALAGQGLGFGVNVAVEGAELLLPPGVIDWLAERLRHRPDPTAEKVRGVESPTGLDTRLLSALDAKLAGLAGMAAHAYLAGARYDDGPASLLLTFINPVPGAEDALAQAVNEAVAFGTDAASIDVMFAAAENPIAARLERVGLRLDIPRVKVRRREAPGAPGMDPDRPPRLR